MIVLPGVQLQVPAIYKDTSIQLRWHMTPLTHFLVDAELECMSSLAVLFTYYFTHLGILNGSLQVSPIIQRLPAYCTGHHV